MTPSDIDRIASAYADTLLPAPKTYDDEALWREYYTQARSVVEVLSGKILMVEREKMVDRYLQAESDILSDDYLVSQTAYAEYRLMAEIFGQDII